MEEDALEITELWRAFLDVAPAGVAVFDRAMRYLQASTRWKRDYGIREDVLGRSHYEIFPDIPERWKEIHRRCLAGAEAACDADPFPRAEGTTDWIRWQIRPWHRRSGEIGGIVIFSELITERVRAEQALRESEERYRALIDQAPEAIVLYDQDAQRAVQINRQAERLFGCDAAEFNRRGLPSFYHPDQPDGLPVAQSFAERDRLSRAGTMPPFERRILNANGEERCCEVTLQKLPTATGHISRASFVDITGRKQAEARVRQQEALYRGLVEQQISGIVILDSDGRFAYVNPHFADIAGYPAAELVGRPLTDVVLADEIAGVREKLAEQLAGEAGFVQLLSKLVTRTGEVRDILVNATRSTWEGRPASTAVVLDVTERRIAIEALRRGEARYRTTIDLAPVGIVHIADDGRYLLVNDFMCGLLGYSREELLGMTFFDVTDAEDMAASRSRLERRLSGETVGRFVKRYRHRDGRRIWAEVVISDLVAEDGTRCGIGIVNDITERKRAEDEKLRLAAQLQQSQKMEAIGQLTGGMAHDFNNLLAVILGNLDFLMERPEIAGEARELVDAATQAVLKGSELTRNLLAFARRQPLAPTLRDVGDVLHRVARLLLRTLGAQIAVELRLDERLWPVMIDEAQLESAMLNLAVNARDAMPSGGRLMIEARTVTLDAEAAQHNAEATPGDFIVISVSDTGAGMPPEVAARAFDPFFTTKGNRGTGLGLSMVHGFVRQSGGHTRLYSEPGRGTRIDIYLPRAAAAARDAASEPASPELARGNESVLVVEDNEALRRLAVRRLADLGYHTVEACDAADALGILRGDAAVDLLFTDVVMPGGMDGRQLADAARRLRPVLKVLFTSGFTAAASGNDDSAFSHALLTKPYTKEVLARRLREALEGG